MIADLIKRWSELEPERCRAYQGGLSDLDSPFMYSVLLTVGRRSGWVEIGLMNTASSTSGLATLQYALQQAIVAHGFRLRLEYLTERWEAVVSTRRDDRGFLPYENGDEPTIVILRSYVSCLESERNEAQ